MTEQWKPVVGYEGYAVSDSGQVKSWRKAKVDGRLMKQSLDSDGYPAVGLYDATQRRLTSRVSTLVVQAFIGPRPEGLVVRHLDGDKMNSALSNLTYGTISQNVLDEVSHGTHNNASKTHCPKGHLYDEMNTRLRIRATTTSRDCRACNRDRMKRSRKLKAVSV